MKKIFFITMLIIGLSSCGSTYMASNQPVDGIYYAPTKISRSEIMKEEQEIKKLRERTEERIFVDTIVLQNNDKVTIPYVEDASYLIKMDANQSQSPTYTLNLEMEANPYYNRNAFYYHDDPWWAYGYPYNGYPYHHYGVYGRPYFGISFGYHWGWRDPWYGFNSWHNPWYGPSYAWGGWYDPWYGPAYSWGGWYDPWYGPGHHHYPGYYPPFVRENVYYGKRGSSYDRTRVVTSSRNNVVRPSTLTQVRGTSSGNRFYPSSTRDRVVADSNTNRVKSGSTPDRVIYDQSGRSTRPSGTSISSSTTRTGEGSKYRRSSATRINQDNNKKESKTTINDLRTRRNTTTTTNRNTTVRSNSSSNSRSVSSSTNRSISSSSSNRSIGSFSTGSSTRSTGSTGTSSRRR